MSSVSIEQFELGPMENYIYFLENTNSKELYIVDPAWEPDTIISKIEQKGYKVLGICITHCHHDHINGVENILKYYDVPVYVSKYEEKFSCNWKENISYVSDNILLSLSGVRVECIHTPGHTKGSQCFLIQDNYLVAGDTLFLDGCGRCDLEGGDPEIMYDTLYNKLLLLPDDTIVYPGHNYHMLSSDTLESQKNTNPYLQFIDIKSFVKYRMR